MGSLHTMDILYTYYIISSSICILYGSHIKTQPSILLVFFICFCLGGYRKRDCYELVFDDMETFASVDIYEL
jgi:uncharacterized membrane protein